MFWCCFQFLTKDVSLQFVTRNELTPSFPFSVSLLALQNDEAVLVLCYAVLEGNCLSSMLAMAWKEMERRVFGFGDLVKTPTSAFGPHCVQATSWEKLTWVTREASSKPGIQELLKLLFWEVLSLLFPPDSPLHPPQVCDNLGRHHMDLCPDCAFCSLKREQCQNMETLNRVHCDSGGFSTYINPQISAQHEDAEGKVLSKLYVLLLSKEEPGLGAGEGEEEAWLTLSHSFAVQILTDPGGLQHGLFERDEAGVLVQPFGHLWL